MGMGGVYGELGGLLNNTYQIVGSTVAGVIGDVQNYAARKQQESIALAPLAQQELLLQQIQKAIGGGATAGAGGGTGLASLLGGQGGAAGAGGTNPLAAFMSLLSGQGGAARAGQQNPFAGLLGGAQGGAGGAQQNPMQAIVAFFAMLLQGLQGQRQA
jgi:hypothetical protein